MIMDIINKVIDKITGNGYAVYAVQGSDVKPILIFDTVTESFVRKTASITSYPTESGIMATDYKYMNPSQISIKGVIKRGSLAGSFLQSLIGFGDPIKKITTELDNYIKGMYALNIQTKTGLYENYALKSYEIPEDYDNYGLCEITAVFQEIPQMNETVQNVEDSLKDTINGGIARLIGLT